MSPKGSAIPYTPTWWIGRVGGFLIGFFFSSNIVSALGKFVGWAQGEAFPSIINIIASTSVESQILSTIIIGVLIIGMIKAVFMVGHLVTWAIIGGIVAGIALPIIIDWQPIDLGNLIMDRV